MMDRLLREGNPPTGQLASPKPQYKKPGEDAYEPVEGQYGAPFAILKNASGQVISPATDAKLEQVRQLLAGVATEAKLEQARTLLDAISTKDFATQTTLAAVLAKLADLESELATSSKQDALNIAVEDLKSELILVKSELANIKANQISGDQKVQLSGTIMEYYGATVAQRPEATEVPVGAAYMAVNTGDVWQSNGFEWVVL